VSVEQKHIGTLQQICRSVFSNSASAIVLQLDELEEELSYADAEDLVCAIEKRLFQDGAAAGDRICSIAPLNLEAILLAWACFRLGMVFVPLDHTWPEDMLNFVIDETEPRIVFVLSSVSVRSGVTVVVYDETSAQSQRLTFAEWLHNGYPFVCPSADELNESDAAVILYTSGSTGRPKGVVLSQGSLIRSGLLVVELFEWSSKDVFLNLGDLHSMSGLRNTCIAPLIAGCRAVIASEKCRSEILLLPETIKRNGCTFVGVSPVVIRQLNMSASRFSLDSFASLRAMLCTGGFLAPEQVRLFFNNFGRPVLNYYGLTETTGLCAGHSFATFDPDEISIGKEAGAIMQIVDHNDSQLPDNEVGHLRIKGPNLMLGYFKQLPLQDEVLKNGWYYTGDLAQRRPDGHFILRGRTRNIIKNIYTDLICLEEVELALESHPTVLEVGIHTYQSEFDDERMAALIVLKESARQRPSKILAEELRQFLHKAIGKRRVPHRFYFIDKLVRNSQGKLLRDKLGELIDDSYMA